VTAIAAAPLEERDRELEAVTRVVESARSGAGGALLVEGPPGIGKTRLLGSARAAAGEDVRVLSARGSELERDFPFAVVRQLLEAVVEPSLLTGAAALAAPVLEDSAAAVEAGPAALHGLYWLTANLAAREPLLVLVDDLHWADLASLRWLAYLVQRLDGLACAVVAATRPAQDGHGEEVLDVLATHADVELLHPGGLSDAAVARIVARELGAPDAAFAAACREVTGGNPFLLGELLRELAGVAPSAANAALVARQTSRTVGRAALARLRRLPPAATALARAAVILGDCAELPLTARLAEIGIDEAAVAADALVSAAILAPPDDAPIGTGVSRVLAFAHPLVAASIYADLGPGERSRAHARAAALLSEAGRSAERVAVHAHKCDPAGDQEAVRVLREAAAQARRRGATEVAASHLRRALDEPPAAEEAPRVRRELGLVEIDGGHMEEAAAHLAAAVAGLADPVERATAAMRLSLALQMSGRPQDGVSALNDAIASLPESERELGLLLQAVRGGASQGNLAAAARVVAPRFHASLDAPRTAGERLYAGGVAYAEATAGSAARAIELGRLAISLLDDPGPGAPSVYVAPLALFFAGALEEATDAFTKVIEHGRRHGSAFGFGSGSHLRAGAWLRRGNLAEAEADAENALPYPSCMVRTGVVALVEIRLAQGDVAGAAAIWADAGLDADPMAGRASVTTRNTRAHLLAAQGRAEEALAQLRACGRMEDDWKVGTPAYSCWRADAVTLLAALGRGDEARALAAEDVARSRAFADPRTLGISLRAAGLAAAGNRAGSSRPAAGDLAIDLLAESVAVLESSPARLEHALSLLELGAAHRRAGRRTDARGPLKDAVDLATACGATAAAARAHDELVAAGAKPRRDPTESRSRLTASESRVARMAADGMTNREIAQALFLTEKTIEVHLTSTYRKLDISSRSQLPRALG
jgi:DNA-binding CsgD family transcriptional regulator